MSRRKGFWNHYPMENWVKADWDAWDRAGRPRVPVENRLSAKPPPTPLDLPPRVDPRGGLFNGFELNPKPRPRHQNARSREVDRLLESMGIRPR
jgi:hypothetical protein